MSIFYNSPVKNSIIVYLIVSIGLLYFKPLGFYDGSEYYHLRSFGVGENKTLLTYPMLLYLSAIFITFYFEFNHFKKY